MATSQPKKFSKKYLVKKNFLPVSEAFFCGRKHYLIERQDDNYRFWIDDFVFEVIDFIIFNNNGRKKDSLNELMNKWDIDLNEFNLLEAVLFKEKIIVEEY